MGTGDWYRNTTWSSTIEEEFEARLQRSRGTFHKAQYLRIQAGNLLGSPDKNIQLIGLRLMNRLISDFSTEEFSTIIGQEQLGDYYLNSGDFDKAEQSFRIVTNHYKNKKSRSGTSAMADLKLAETILISKQSDKLEEAYDICKGYPINELTFNSDKFYYTGLLAHLCDKMNKKEEAKEYAKAALQLSTITEPQLIRHKNVGLINLTEKRLRSLKQIADGIRD